MPVEGGEEEQVLESTHEGSYEVVEDGVYFVPASTPKAGFSLQFLRFATGAVEHVFRFERQPALGNFLDVSPDGRSILYNQFGLLNRSHRPANFAESEDKSLHFP